MLKAPYEHQETNFYCKGDQRLEEVALNCEVFYPGDVNDLMWSWSALADLARAEIGLNDARGHLQPYRTVLSVTTLPKLHFSTGSWFGNYIASNLSRTYKSLMKINPLCLVI